MAKTSTVTEVAKRVLAGRVERRWVRRAGYRHGSKQRKLMVRTRFHWMWREIGGKERAADKKRIP